MLRIVGWLTDILEFRSFFVFRVEQSTSSGSDSVDCLNMKMESLDPSKRR
jgi:hypothetical protein